MLQKNTLPDDGFMRLKDVLNLIPISKSRWYEGVRNGEFPSPISLGQRARAYRVCDIKALLDKFNSAYATA